MNLDLIFPSRGDIDERVLAIFFNERFLSLSIFVGVEGYPSYAPPS